MNSIFSMDNTLEIFGTAIPFVFICAFFMGLLIISLLIYVIQFIFKKNNNSDQVNNLESEKIKIDEEINSIVKSTKIRKGIE